MKNIIYLFLLVSILILSTKAANASSIFGSETRWRNLGNDTFEITIIAYTRCTDLATTFYLSPPSISSDSCANSYSINMGAPLDSTYIDLTPVCKTQQSPCVISGGNGNSSAAVPVGYVKVSWRYKIYLGGQYANCCWYKIRWQFCCRHSNITTGAADSVFTNDAWMNRCIQNNSPIFTNDPLVTKCTSQDVVYNNGAIDTENDSISYRLAPLVTGSYTSPWSYAYPITCLGGNNPNPNTFPPTGFNLNPTNGDLLFRSMQVQISVIKIEAIEWRKINGVSKIIGRTSREIQFITYQSCNNKLPSILGPFAYEACAGKQLCITINTTDQDLTDTTQLLSNALIAIPGSTWNVVDTVKHAIGTFCWTPSDSQISTLPYYFDAIVKDNHCPLKGVNSRAFSIIVKPSPNYSTTITHLSGNQWKFEATPTGTFTNVSYEWYVPKLIGAGLPNQVFAVSQIAYYNFTRYGKYIIRSKMYNNTSCFAEKFDTIDVYCATPLELISTNDSTICIGNAISISTTSITGSAPFTYKWYANGVLTDTTQTITVSPVINTSYRVVVVSGDSCAYTNKDTVNILVDTSSLVVQPISDKRICRGTQITITPIIIGSQIQSFYRWYFNGVIINASKTLVHRPQVSGVYVFEVQSKGNCFVNLRDTFNVFVDTNSISLNSMKDTIVCKGASVSFTPNIKNGKSPYHYQWYSNGVLIDSLSSITIIVNNSQQYQVRVISSDSCHSVAYDTVMVIADTSRLLMQTLSDTSFCEGSMTQIIPQVLSGTLPIQYSWYENNSLISTKDTLQIIPTKASSYILKSVSSDACYNTLYDTVHVNFLPKTLTVQTTRDTTICFNTPYTFKAILSGGNTYNYSWCPVGKSCSTLPNPVYTFDTTTKVYLEITSNAICTEVYRDSITIHVFPQSRITITAKDQTINKNQSTILKAGNGSGFVWYGNSIAQNWGDSIEVNPMLTNTYKVIGKNIYGCTDSAQITITVTHVGIDNQNVINSTLNIHPNPAKDAITVNGYQNQYYYEIDNIFGQQVLRGELTSNSTLIDIHSLPAGIYFIKVETEVKKWIKE